MAPASAICFVSEAREQRQLPAASRGRPPTSVSSRRSDRRNGMAAAESALYSSSEHREQHADAPFSPRRTGATTADVTTVAGEFGVRRASVGPPAEALPCAEAPRDCLPRLTGPVATAVASHLTPGTAVQRPFRGAAAESTSDAFGGTGCAVLRAPAVGDAPDGKSSYERHPVEATAAPVAATLRSGALPGTAGRPETGQRVEGVAATGSRRLHSLGSELCVPELVEPVKKAAGNVPDPEQPVELQRPEEATKQLWSLPLAKGSEEPQLVSQRQMKQPLPAERAAPRQPNVEAHNSARGASQKHTIALPNIAVKEVTQVSLSEMESPEQSQSERGLGKNEQPVSEDPTDCGRSDVTVTSRSSGTGTLLQLAADDCFLKLKGATTLRSLHEKTGCSLEKRWSAPACSATNSSSVDASTNNKNAHEHSRAKDEACIVSVNSLGLSGSRSPRSHSSLRNTVCGVEVEECSRAAPDGTRARDESGVEVSSCVVSLCTAVAESCATTRVTKKAALLSENTAATKSDPQTASSALVNKVDRGAGESEFAQPTPAGPRAAAAAGDKLELGAPQRRMMTRRRTVQPSVSVLGDVSADVIHDLKCSSSFGDEQLRLHAAQQQHQQQVPLHERVPCQLQLVTQPDPLRQQQHRASADICFQHTAAAAEIGVIARSGEARQHIVSAANITRRTAVDWCALADEAEEVGLSVAAGSTGKDAADNPCSTAGADFAGIATSGSETAVPPHTGAAAGVATGSGDALAGAGRVVRSILMEPTEGHTRWSGSGALARAPASPESATAAAVGDPAVSPSPAGIMTGTARATASHSIGAEAGVAFGSQPGGAAPGAGHPTVPGCSSDRSALAGASARRSLSRASPSSENAISTTAGGAAGVTRCSPRHIRKGAGVERQPQQQQQLQPHQRGGMVPLTGVDLESLSPACPLPQSLLRRPLGPPPPSGSTSSRNISLKRRTCTGKSRSGVGRCPGNGARKDTDANDVRFDASWFLPQESWSHCGSGLSYAGFDGPRKRMKLRKDGDAKVDRCVHETGFSPPCEGRDDSMEDGTSMSVADAPQLYDAAALAAQCVEATERGCMYQYCSTLTHLTSSRSPTAAGSDRVSGFVDVPRERTWAGAEGDSVAVSSGESEVDGELDGYLSDVEAAVRALDDPLAPIRQLQPHERPRCCVCGLPRRPLHTFSSTTADADTESSSWGGGNGVDECSSAGRSNNRAVAAWEPLCACTPRFFGENTLQGRAGKNTLLYPPAAAPLRYTLHPLSLKPGLQSDKTNSHTILGAGCTASSGCSTIVNQSSTGTNMNSSLTCLTVSSVQSSSCVSMCASSQPAERPQGWCGARKTFGRYCVRRSSGSSNAVSVADSCRSENHSACSPGKPDDNRGEPVKHFDESGDRGDSTTHLGSPKLNRRFCRWRDLATLQNYCAPLEQLQDSLAATVASAAAAGAAAGRSVVFLPRLFWDPETDCYVASCLGYCSAASNDGSTNASSRSGNIDAVAAGTDVELRLLQKRFSARFLGDAKAHFYACMWLNWHYEQANVVQRKQQQLRQELLEQQQQQLVHFSRAGGGLAGHAGAAAPFRKRQGHALPSAGWKEPQKGSSKYETQPAVSPHWRQHMLQSDTANSEDETEEERKARLRQESLARQKRHKLERQQWRRQQARLARLLLQQQQQQEEQHQRQQKQRQQQQRHSPKQHQQQHRQQHGQHVSCVPSGRAGVAEGEQAAAGALAPENRSTRAAGNNISCHSQNQRSSGEVPAPMGYLKAAAAGGDRSRHGTAHVTGRGATAASGGRHADAQLSVTGIPANVHPTETAGPAALDQGAVPAVLGCKMAPSAQAIYNSTAEAVNRGATLHHGTAAGGLQVPTCSASPGGARAHRRSDGAQTPPVVRGSSRESLGGNSRSGSSHKAYKTSRSSSTVATSTGNNRSSSDGSTSSRGGTSGAAPNGRASSGRGGVSKQGHSTFVSPSGRRASAYNAPNQASPGSPTGAAAASGAPNTGGPGGAPSPAGSRGEGLTSASSVSPGTSCAASADAGSCREGDLAAERAELASAGAARGKGRGRINARRYAAVVKARGAATEKPRPKNRSVPPLTAAAVASAGTAPPAGAPAASPLATAVAAAEATTPAVPATVAPATVAGPTQEGSSDVHAFVSAASMTRSAGRTAGVGAALARPACHSSPVPGGEAPPAGSAEGAVAGGERGDPAPPGGVAASAERRSRGARASPRCLSLATGASVAVSIPTAPTAAGGGAAAAATAAALSAGTDAEKRTTPVSAYTAPICVASPAAAGGASGVGNGPASAAVTSARAGGGRGRGAGAFILGTPEKLKAGTRAHQRSAAGPVPSAAAAAEECCAGGGAAQGQPQEVNFCEEQAPLLSAVESGAGGSSVTTGSCNTDETEPLAGTNGSPQLPEEQQTARAPPAGRSAAPTADATVLGPAAGAGAGAGVTVAKREGKPWKNWGDSPAEDRRWGTAVRQRQSSRRQRDARR